MRIPSRRFAILGFVFLAGCPPPVPQGPSFFLVAEPVPFHNDSFILELTNPEDVAQAHRIVDRPNEPGPKIVVADIAEGSGDPPNRDLLNGGVPWSWHLSEFIGFADFTIEILDGWPGFIEEDLQGWINNTGGTIGFWTYTVVRELTDDEVADLMSRPASALGAISH